MQRTSGTSKRGQHVFDMFMKTSAFTRYILNDILPKEIFKNPFNSPIEVLTEECDSLITSIKKTKDLFKAINYDSNSNEKEDLKKEIPINLKEMFKSILLFLKFPSHMNNINPYYCELCESCSHSKDGVNKHFMSEEHGLYFEDTNKFYLFYKCEICNLHIMATKALMNEIIKSEEHQLIDAKIKDEVERQSNSEVSLNNSSKWSEDDIRWNDSETNSVKEEKEATVSWMNNDNGTPVYYKNQWKIPDLLLDANEMQSSGEIQCFYYCRVCEVSYFKLEDWHDHLDKSVKKHYAKQNCIKKCFQCSTVMLGFRPLMKIFLQYHKEICHIKSKSKQTLGSNISLDGQINTISSNENLNIIEENINTSKDIENNDLKNSFNEVQILTYLNALKDKLIEYNLYNHLKTFKAVCLLCPIAISNESEWASHIYTKHYQKESESQAKERICEFCNIRVYGNQEIIENTLWSINDHKEIDSLGKLCLDNLNM